MPTQWDNLEAKFLTRRTNHSEAYSTPDACTNMAESFFSRIRRAEIGIHHHIAGPYLAYAMEMPWREGSRWISNGEHHARYVFGFGPSGVAGLEGLLAAVRPSSSRPPSAPGSRAVRNERSRSDRRT